MGKTFNRRNDNDYDDARKEKFSNRRTKRLRTITNKHSAIEKDKEDD